MLKESIYGAETPPLSSEMSLYPENMSGFDLERFTTPQSIDRGMPFWAWNGILDREQLLDQLNTFKTMGFGGAVIHARTGLATEYLGEEYMSHVQSSVQWAKENGLHIVLYDEDRYPSGYAGGIVTENPKFRAKELVMTTEDSLSGKEEVGFAGEGELLARYAVTMDNGSLTGYRRLQADESAHDTETVWHAFLRTVKRESWYNNYTYLDTLSQEAVQEFINVTYEKYYEFLGDDFGKTVTAIFTDEPMYQPCEPPSFAEGQEEATLAWTTDLSDTYRDQFGEDILSSLPELFWDSSSGEPAKSRLQFYDHLTKRFSTAYVKTIGEWCKAHNVTFTGHLNEEPKLDQIRVSGDVMQSYNEFSLPGIDMLSGRKELTTAKQALSVARQKGLPGILSEQHGVSGWDISFADLKRQIDWQKALGVVWDIPHHAWYTMSGEAKRDYPAPFGQHSPWFEEAALLQDHAARLNVALSSGLPICNIAVIHPGESYTLLYGSRDQGQNEKEVREEEFFNITEWLLYNQTDFDFISEGLLPSQNASLDGKSLQVGAMKYDTVLVPDLRTIRSTTLDALTSFVNAGGKVIFAGMVPTLVDGEKSDLPEILANRSLQVQFAKEEILAEIENHREVEVLAEDGERQDELLYQMRQDGPNRIVYLTNSTDDNQGGTVRIRGIWNASVLDTFEGTRSPLQVKHEEADEVWTSLIWEGLPLSDLLLYLEPTTELQHGKLEEAPEIIKQEILLEKPERITLSEPNVLLLDQAEFKLDDGLWEKKEELLRVDRRLRSRLGLPLRDSNMAQPWASPSGMSEHTVSLRFDMQSDVALRNTFLALEGAEVAQIMIDGQMLETKPSGYWVDPAIGTVAVPELTSGEHKIEVTLPFGGEIPLEWMHLLGNFGVDVDKDQAKIIEMPQTIDFGDWTTQGFPFYGGNMTYHCSIAGGDKARLRIPEFKGTLIVAELDNNRIGPIAFPPYSLELGKTNEGEHSLDLTVISHRFNPFGPLHNSDPGEKWWGPQSWRTTGEQWTDGYQVRPLGILEPPIITR